MRISFSITIKLLLFVLPLVCIPIAVVGYLSYKASVESVTRLSRNEQMLQAKGAATEINSIFESCCRDLEIMAEFISEDFLADAVLPLEVDTEQRSEKILKLFHDFGLRSPYYIRVRFFDSLGREVIGPEWGGQDGRLHRQVSDASFRLPLADEKQGCHVSRIVYSQIQEDYVVQFSKPLLHRDESPAGRLVIDLDFGKVIELVNAIQIGERGFAFMVDQSGRTIAHPLFKPYEYDLSKYDDPRLREFVVDMITGETGWRTYFHLGEKAAAFAPVPATGWSLAVSIPIEEFKKEAKAIRARVLEMVIVMLILSGLGIGLLSYQLLRPVRRLVFATERMGAGDLWQEIPVKSRDELGTLTRSFNRMIRNLRKIQTELIRSEKLISLGRLSAGVAHEVRNPLNAMKGAIVHLQKRKSKDPLIKEYTHLILEEIDRLNEFVSEFLHFAKQSTPNCVPTDLNELLQNTLNLLDEEFRTKRIKVSIDPEFSLPLLQIDPHQMEQVFLNLFNNAMHAMPDGGVLTVSTVSRGTDQEAGSAARAVVKVKDEGKGVPQEHLQSIFDPFFSTKEAGTGLGLPISLGIVEGHGGKIEVLSREGEGTTVIIELPLEGGRPHREIEDDKENPDR
jgi:two-component system NtrC family sensor kinase